MHSNYQVNPTGALVDYDRGVDNCSRSNWESQAEVKTHAAIDRWTVEIRIPVRCTYRAEPRDSFALSLVM